MIEVYKSTNTSYQKNGDITLTPLECVFEWGLDGICQIELTHEYDDLGRWEYLVNDNVIAAPTPYSDKQLFRIYKREKSDDEVTVYARHVAVEQQSQKEDTGEAKEEKKTVIGVNADLETTEEKVGVESPVNILDTLGITQGELDSIKGVLARYE